MKKLDINDLPNEQKEELLDSLNTYEAALYKIITPEEEKELFKKVDQINKRKSIHS